MTMVSIQRNFKKVFNRKGVIKLAACDSILKIAEEQRDELDRVKFGAVTFVIVNGLVERVKPQPEIRVNQKNE